MLAKEAKQYCSDVIEVEGVANAIDNAISSSNEQDLILITGSLYTVGEARSHLLNII
jgi:dihydrofolate synthase/folylpolyglutamate synthase